MGDMNINNYDIKLHKTDGKKIGTGNLEGIRVTDQNKSIFDGHVCDIDNDGKPSEKEKQLAASLRQAAADGVISGEETKVLYEYLDIMTGRDNTIGKDDFHASNADLHDDLFKGLVDIANQQAHWASGAEEYEYTLEGKTITTNKDGSLQVIRNADGSSQYTSTEIKDGVKTTTVENFPTAEAAENAQPSSRLETVVNGDQVTNSFTEYTYNEDGTVISVLYNGTDNTGECLGVTKDGMKAAAPAALELGFEGEVSISANYASMDAMNNNVPSSVTYLPAQGEAVIVQLTPVEGKDGVFKATYTKADGTNVEKEVTLKDLGLVGGQQQEQVQNNDNNQQTVTQQTTYTDFTVKPNMTNHQIAKQALIDAGITNPTAEQIKTAREAIEAANQDQLKVSTGRNKGVSWGKATDAQKEAGNTYFYANATIKMPDKATLLGETKPAEGAAEQGGTTTANAQAYTVVSGDSLWKIAVKQLGDDAKPGEIYNYMKELAELNGKTIDSNGMCMIRPGEELKLPGKADAAAPAPEVPAPETPAPAPEAPEPTAPTEAGTYAIENDAVYNALSTDEAKAKYKEFMETKWKDGEKFVIDDANSASNGVEFTMLTRADGQRVFAQGVLQYTIGFVDNSSEPYPTQTVANKDGEKVTYDGVEYTIKASGDTYYLVAADGTSRGVDDKGVPFTITEGAIVFPYGCEEGECYSVMKYDGGLCYFKAETAEFYEINMPDHSVGKKLYIQVA